MLRYIKMEEHYEIVTEKGESSYIPNFLTKVEADKYFNVFKDLPFRQGEIFIHGRYCDEARLTCLFGDSDGQVYHYAGKEMVSHAWTPELLELKNKVQESVGEDDYNTCLINYYKDGTKNIGLHSDSERDLLAHSYIASVSLGAVRHFDVVRKDGSIPKKRIDLAHGSLIIMDMEMQRNYKHTVPVQKRVKEPRINLTFRCAKV